MLLKTQGRLLWVVRHSRARWPQFSPRLQTSPAAWQSLRLLELGFQTSGMLAWARLAWSRIPQPAVSLPGHRSAAPLWSRRHFARLPPRGLSSRDVLEGPFHARDVLLSRRVRLQLSA